MAVRAIFAVVLWCALGAAGAGGPVLDRVADFDVPVQPLADALLQLSLQADMELVVVGSTRGLDSRAAVRGRMALEQALGLVVDPAQWSIDAAPGGLVRVMRRPRSLPAQEVTPPAQPRIVDHHSVVVTARRREESRLDVPVSVQRIQGSTAVRFDRGNVASMLDLIPGVSAVDHGRGFTSVQIRGISSSLGGNENGYYLDDIAFTGVTVPWYPDADGFDIDHVEVLKGPQGTLFGEGSLGGTVRIQTRAPVPGEFDAAAGLGLSATADGDSGWMRQAMVNLPLGERAAARIVTAKTHAGGWVDDAVTGASDINRQDRQIHRVRLRAEPGDHFRLDLSWWRHMSNSPGGGHGARDDGTTPFHYGASSGWTVAGVGGRWQLPASVVHITLSRAALENKARGELVAGVDYYGDIDIDIDQVELRWNSDSSAGWDWTTGYSWRGARRADRNWLSGGESAGVQRNIAHALFAEAIWRIPGTRLAASAGARYFNDHVDSSSSTGEVQTDLDATFATWSPRLALSFRPDAHSQWYMAHARGFRSGQLQPASSLAAAGSLGIALPGALEPDTVDTLEVGYRREPAGGRSQIEASVYRSNWRNVPVRVPLAMGLNGLVSARAAHARGAELAWGWRSEAELDLRQTVSYVDAEYRDAIPGTAVQYGAAVYNVPAWSTTSMFGKGWVLPHGTTLALHGWLQWLAPRNTGLLVGSRGEPVVLAGTRLEWGLSSRHRLAWSVENLFNEDGAIDARDAHGVAVRPRPRTFGMQWQVRL